MTLPDVKCTIFIHDHIHVITVRLHYRATILVTVCHQDDTTNNARRFGRHVHKIYGTNNQVKPMSMRVIDAP